MRCRFRKRMRWGALDAQFVRPVHWLVMLLGTRGRAGELLGVSCRQLQLRPSLHGAGPLRICSRRAATRRHCSARAAR